MTLSAKYNAHPACRLFLFAAMLLVFYAVAIGQSKSKGSQSLPSVRGRAIYFVAIGEFPDEEFKDLVEFYRKKFKLEIHVLKTIPIDSSEIDARRGQLIAETLVDHVYAAFPKLASQGAVLIGFTRVDMYPVSKNWRFAFGWRKPALRAAVVSSARMDLHYAGEPQNTDLPGSRLRKMVTKDIGILYYGLSTNNNPRSVLYDQILGIEELDAVSEDF